jgi:hypothetical protein
MERLQGAGLVAEGADHLVEEYALDLLLGSGQERAEALRRHERGRDPPRWVQVPPIRPVSM